MSTTDTTTIIIEKALRAAVAGEPLPDFRTRDAGLLMAAIESAVNSPAGQQRVGLLALELLLQVSRADATAYRLLRTHTGRSG